MIIHGYFGVSKVWRGVEMEKKFAETCSLCHHQRLQSPPHGMYHSNDVMSPYTSNIHSHFGQKKMTIHPSFQWFNMHFLIFLLTTLTRENSSATDIDPFKMVLLSALEYLLRIELKEKRATEMEWLWWSAFMKKMMISGRVQNDSLHFGLFLIEVRIEKREREREGPWFSWAGHCNHPLSS